MKKILLILLVTISTQASFDFDRINPIKKSFGYLKDARDGIMATRKTITHNMKKVSKSFRGTLREDIKKIKYYSHEVREVQEKQIVAYDLRSKND